MKLDKLHVDQFRARVIRQRMSVAGVFPAVAGNFVGASNSAGGEYDCFRPENFEATALAFIAKSANRAISIDRKSTRLNSSHEWISYAVFCLKKKKKT